MAACKRVAHMAVAASSLFLSIVLHHPVTTHTAHTTFDFVVFTAWGEVTRAIGAPIQAPH